MCLSAPPALLPYRLPLGAPLPLARGAPLTERAGCLLLLSGTGATGEAVHGISELCPLPGFHAEGYDAACDQLRRVALAMRGRRVPFELARLGGRMRSWLGEAPSGLEAGEARSGVRRPASARHFRR